MLGFTAFNPSYNFAAPPPVRLVQQIVQMRANGRGKRLSVPAAVIAAVEITLADTDGQADHSGWMVATA